MIDEQVHEPSCAGDVAAPVLELLHVSVAFGGIRALNDVSMAVNIGEVHGLMGANGAGKTTLFDIISGIRRPTCGTVLLGGIDVSHWSAKSRALHGLRRTFQRVQIFGRLTVAENLLLPLEELDGVGAMLADLVALPRRRGTDAAVRLRVAEVAKQCGLTAVLDRPAGALPIALCRQVELARALIAKPRALLLDEPTSGLDHAEVERLSRLLADLAANQSCGVLLVEHDVAFTMANCRTVTVLDRGELIAQGSPAEIQANPAVHRAYFDT